MLGGVVQEVAEHLAQPVRVPRDGAELLLAVGVVDGDVLGRQELVVGVDGILQLGLDVHRLHRQGEAAVLNPGELQQLLHHPRQPPGLAGDDGHALAHVPFVPGLAAHDGLGPAGDGGQRGAQFVGDRGDELRLHALRLLDPQGHVVDGVGEVPHLVVELLFHLDAVASPGDPPGDAGDVLHRVHDGADEVDVGDVHQDQNAHRQDHRHQGEDGHLPVHQAHGGDVAHDPHQLPVVQQGGGDRRDPLAGLGQFPLPGGNLLLLPHPVDVPGARHGAGEGQAVGGVDHLPRRVQKLQLQPGAVLEGADVVLGGGEIVLAAGVSTGVGAEVVGGNPRLALHIGEDAAVIVIADDHGEGHHNHQQNHHQDADAVEQPPLADAFDL